MVLTLGTLLRDPTVWIILGVVILGMLWFSRHYIKAMFRSLMADVGEGILSFADEFFIAGLSGLDVGDWAAGLLLFLYYRKQLGFWGALFILLESANFGLSLIPGVGVGFEYFFNFFPMISFVVLYKQHQANSIYHPIKEYNAFLKTEDQETHKKMKGEIDHVSDLYENCSYQELHKIGTGVKEALFAEVKQVIMKKLNKAQELLITVLQKEVQSGNTTVSQQEIEQYKVAIERVIQDIPTNWQMAAQEAEQIQQRLSSLAYAVGHPRGAGVFGIGAKRKMQKSDVGQEGIMKKAYPQKQKTTKQPVQQTSQEPTVQQPSQKSSGIEQRFQSAYKKAGVKPTAKTGPNKKITKPPIKKTTVKKKPALVK
jgi:hypothetical protein